MFSTHVNLLHLVRHHGSYSVRDLGLLCRSMMLMCSGELGLWWSMPPAVCLFQLFQSLQDLSGLSSVKIPSQTGTGPRPGLCRPLLNWIFWTETRDARGVWNFEPLRKEPRVYEKNRACTKTIRWRFENLQTEAKETPHKALNGNKIERNWSYAGMVSQSLNKLVFNWATRGASCNCPHQWCWHTVPAAAFKRIKRKFNGQIDYVSDALQKITTWAKELKQNHSANAEARNPSQASAEAQTIAARSTIQRMQT